LELRCGGCVPAFCKAASWAMMMDWHFGMEQKVGSAAFVDCCDEDKTYECTVTPLGRMKLTKHSFPNDF